MMITIVAKEGRKIIERFDVDLLNTTKWVAQDHLGGWFEFSDTEPWSGTSAWVNGLMWTGLRQGKENPDWRDTLIKVSDIK